MMVPEHVKLPLLNTAAAHGAEETVLPPMIRGDTPPSSAASAAAGMARLPRTVATEATTMRMRTPGSFRVGRCAAGMRGSPDGVVHRC
jgi:hypothetical protein